MEYELIIEKRFVNLRIKRGAEKVKCEFWLNGALSRFFDFEPGMPDDYALSDYYPNPRRFFAPQAYATSGLEYDERLIHKTAFKPAEHAKPIAEAVEAFFSLRKPPTAIVLPGADYLAPFQEELRLKRIKSPEDVSFIVFDDISMDAALHVTTIRKPVSEMAEMAFKVLKEKIASPHSPNTRVLLEPELIERDSVAFRGQGEVRP